MKKTFKETLKEVPKPKRLTHESKLPHYFDLIWDLKHGYEILTNEQYLNNPDVRRCLAEFGFDVNLLPKEAVEYVDIVDFL